MQRRELIEAELKRDPTQSDRAIAEKVGVSPTSVGTARAELEATVQIGQSDTRIGKNGVEKPARKAAAKDAADLTREQRRALIESELKRDPSQSDRVIAEKAGVQHQAVSHARAKLEAEGVVDESPTRVGKNGVEQTAKKAAAKDAAKKAKAQQSDAEKPVRPANVDSNDISTLSDLGIPRDRSARAQELARVPEAQFEAGPRSARRRTSALR